MEFPNLSKEKPVATRNGEAVRGAADVRLLKDRAIQLSALAKVIQPVIPTLTVPYVLWSSQPDLFCEWVILVLNTLSPHPGIRVNTSREGTGAAGTSVHRPG